MRHPPVFVICESGEKEKKKWGLDPHINLDHHEISVLIAKQQHSTRRTFCAALRGAGLYNLSRDWTYPHVQHERVTQYR